MKYLHTLKHISIVQNFYTHILQFHTIVNSFMPSIEMVYDQNDENI